MKAQSINGNTRKPYNDKPLREGEVLVPQMVTDRWYAISIGGNPRNFRTWTLAGIRYTVMFVPVSKDKEAISMKAFTEALNELLDERLGPNRHSRCLIPQPDGSVKICPKVNGNNHAPCAQCPHRVLCLFRRRCACSNILSITYPSLHSKHFTQSISHSLPSSCRNFFGVYFFALTLESMNSCCISVRKASLSSSDSSPPAKSCRASARIALAWR